MIKKAIALAGGLLATGGTVLAMSLPASAAVPIVGAALHSQPTLALAGPNTVHSGSLAELKTCIGGGTCTTGAFKLREQFRQVQSTKVTGGFQLILRGTGLALTDRGGLVYFSPASDFASQRWIQPNGAGNPGPLKSVKTGNYLDPVFSAALPYDKLQDGPTQRYWDVLAAS